MSLNDFIHEGPDLLNPLTDVLIRFRRFRYAVTSDIKKMYLNVKVSVNDPGALRILWWPFGNFKLDPIEYQATVHIYGAKSSGFIANYCVQTLGSQCSDKFLSYTLFKDFYVDDQASSIQYEDQACALVKGMHETLSQGGFQLTKFVSNSSAITEALSVLGPKVQIESQEAQSKEIHSILGVQWKIQSDEILLPSVVPDSNTVPTRHSLLSMAAKVYDPLGIVSPAILPVKVMLQQVSFRMGY
jgi:hypothetical protein